MRRQRAHGHVEGFAELGQEDGGGAGAHLGGIEVVRDPCSVTRDWGSMIQDLQWGTWDARLARPFVYHGFVVEGLGSALVWDHR